MQKFKSNDRIVLKKHMDRPLDKFESIYRVVDFYKAASDNEYYYVIEPAEPADKFDNSMALKQGHVEESYINIDEVYWYCVRSTKKSKEEPEYDKAGRETK